MTSSSVSKEKPAINVCIDPKFESTAILNNVLFGVEEEGIPAKVISESKYQGKTTNDLSYEASNSSNLGVGIGIAYDGVTVHFEKMQHGDVLFSVVIDADIQKLRDIGSNAARMVKRMPFKKL